MISYFPNLGGSTITKYAISNRYRMLSTIYFDITSIVVQICDPKKFNKYEIDLSPTNLRVIMTSKFSIFDT